MNDQHQTYQPVRLADYRPPAFLVETVDLVFDLQTSATTVRSRLQVRRNPQAETPHADLALDGEDLELISIAVNGQVLPQNTYSVGPAGLTLHQVPDSFEMEIVTRTDPQANTRLSGLYLSGGIFCTQCEAEGFRRITYFPDRPDVMARYTCTIVADPASCPVLLSNGNPVDRGTAGDNRHWIKWEDPHPKPSYLFALVAGDLATITDHFTTRSGRAVTLNIHVRPEDADKCDHAMASLIKSMEWDEKRFGLEYDLDIYNIVAVSDFNMGAMENKGLNVFNTKYVLARPETATDADFIGIESVIGHEYFHNWTGNRVTCRDWFQLSLKEGLTVFREQEFSSDISSRPVRRIRDVRKLRSVQFPEDAGPTAHPVRPSSYIEINNFYTPTVYEKGSEVIRMQHALIGEDAFQAGMRLYIERHDNSAATIEDFLAAMEEASGQDLSGFMRWYDQAGTPQVTIHEAWNAESGTFSLTLEQHTPATPDHSDKKPLLIPVTLALLDQSGTPMPLHLSPEASAQQSKAGSTERVIAFTQTSETFTFTGLNQKPVPSLFRGFSAPIRLLGQPRERLLFLFGHDTDPFNRWDAGQQLAVDLVLEMGEAWNHGRSVSVPASFLDAFRRTLTDPDADPTFIAEAITLPGENEIADHMEIVDIEAIHHARTALRRQIGDELGPDLRRVYLAMQQEGDPASQDTAAMGCRALKNAALSLLGAAAPERAEGLELALAQFENASTMTDSLAALAVINSVDTPARAQALDTFYKRWRHDPLVLDKWFMIQALSPLPNTLEVVKALTRHEDFDRLNPNRVRSLLGAFATGNPARFHDRAGGGYELLAQEVADADARNPQLAAAMVRPLLRWRRHKAERAHLMRQTLETLSARRGLSPDLFEMVKRGLPNPDADPS